MIGQVDQLRRQNTYAPPESLQVNASELIEGTRTPEEALVYSYTYLHHHVGAVSNAFRLAHGHLEPFEECVLIDYGCGPGAALMGLAEVEYARLSRPLTVHYLGLETRENPAVPIAEKLFDCIQDRGLISVASTRSAAPFADDFSPNYDWPRGSADCPVFFALCFVLAHPFFRVPAPPAPGLRARRDPVTYVQQAIQACRDHYGGPVQLIYANAMRARQSGISVHAGWERLLRAVGLRHDVQTLDFDFHWFESRRITGRGSKTAWQQSTFRQSDGMRRWPAGCDHQILE